MQRKESLLLIFYAVPLYLDTFVPFSSKRFSISLTEVFFSKTKSGSLWKPLMGVSI